MSIIPLLIAALAVVNIDGGAPDDTGKKAKCKVDLIFLDDGSSSICENKNGPFCSNWKSNLEFIKNIIRFLTIGPDDSKVAYLKYGDQTDLRWNLDKYTDEQSLLDAVDKEGIPGGELTSTDSFKVVISDVYNTTVGDRPNIPNVAILITDNAGITQFEAASASAQLQAVAPLKMMVVCLNTTSSICAESCAADVSSPPHMKGVTYFMAAKYAFIDNVRKTLLEHLCEFPIVD